MDGGTTHAMAFIPNIPGEFDGKMVEREAGVPLKLSLYRCLAPIATECYKLFGNENKRYYPFDNYGRL